MMEIFILALIGIAGAAAVLAPIVLADRPTDPGSSTPSAVPAGDDEIDAEVARYRAALRRGTLCRRCLRPNPEHSRYCADCGRPLDGKPASI